VCVPPSSRAQIIWARVYTSDALMDSLVQARASRRRLQRQSARTRVGRIASLRAATLSDAGRCARRAPQVAAQFAEQPFKVRAGVKRTRHAPHAAR
jgi:hypothetical protein